MRHIHKFLIIVALFILTISSNAQSTTIVEVTHQRFDGGEMVYRRDTGAIYVLARNQGRWWYFPSWEYGDLPIRNQYPPAGRQKATNGFARVWTNYYHVQQALGWAVLPELGSEGRFTAASYGRTYYANSTSIDVAELNSDGTFDYVRGIPDDNGATIELWLPERVVARGETLDMSWIANGADHVVITATDLYNQSRVIAMWDNLELVGSRQWTIPETAPEDVRITVAAVRLAPFAGTPTIIYETLATAITDIDIVSDGDLTVQTWAAYQRYERGFMLWREDTSEIRVFYEDGTWQFFDARFYSYNTPYSGSFCASYVEPINGFGRVWGYSDVRQRLGCAVSFEYGYTLSITSDSYSEFLYTLPEHYDIRINNQTWWRQF